MIEFISVTGQSVVRRGMHGEQLNRFLDFENSFKAKVLRLIRQGVYKHKLFTVVTVDIYAKHHVPHLAFFKAALTGRRGINFFHRDVPEAAGKLARLGILPMGAHYALTVECSHVFDAYRDPEFHPIFVATWSNTPALDAFPAIGRAYTAWIQAREKKRIDELRSNKGKCEVVFQALDSSFEVVKLLDQAALDHEGYVMHHCIGRYGHALTRDGEYVLSLRENGVSLATAHYTEDRLSQVQGKRNSPVSREVRQLMTDFGTVAPKTRYFGTNNRMYPPIPPRVAPDQMRLVPELGALEGFRWLDEVQAIGRMHRPGQLHPHQEVVINQMRRDPVRFGELFVTGGRRSGKSTFGLMDSVSQTVRGINQALGFVIPGPLVLPADKVSLYDKAKLFQLSVAFDSLDETTVVFATAALYRIIGHKDNTNFREALKEFSEYGRPKLMFPQLVRDILNPDSKYNFVVYHGLTVESSTFPSEARDVKQDHAHTPNKAWHVEHATKNDLPKLDYKVKKQKFVVPGYLGVKDPYASFRALAKDAKITVIDSSAKIAAKEDYMWVHSNAYQDHLGR